MGKNLNGRELGEGLSQRKDGKYSARFRSKSGKRIERYFEKLVDAKKWLNEAKYDDEHNNIAASSNMTVDCWFNIWISQREKQIRKSTCNMYKNNYRNCIQPYIGNICLADIKPIHCQNVINSMQDNKPSYIQAIKALLKMIFQDAVNNELVQKNPVIVKVPKKEKKERRVLTRLEQEIFLKESKKYSYYLAYAFVLQTGLRCGELTGLKWQDIDFNKRSIDICRSVSYDKDYKRFVENSTKTSSGKRTIPLTQQAYEILMQQKDENKRKAVVFGYHDYVFINKHGNPSHKGNYDGALRKIAKKMNVEEFSMHSLRHTFATRCIESGMKPKTLQKILGHSTLSMTMDLYVHVTEDEATKEMKKLENMLCGRMA